MKPIIRMMAAAVMLVCVSLGLKAQQIPPLPVDSAVRVGTLPNGLTYYIRHNEKPKGQADFYIAQRVGSMLENDNQRGLAHFLEHMCFNGTTHFPGKSLIKWLESVGVKFGYNLNASTGFDETIYNISNVPVAREGVQDSCLLILHDWANDLLLEDEEIDAERAVIHEEWRQSNVGQMRILEKLLPEIYPDNKYGVRLPIGTMEIVDNFPYQALRDYYEAWYRPDQQGVVVVGDVDVDAIEAKIRKIFADIEMPADAPERVYVEVEDTPGTIWAIGHDSEQQNALAQMMFKMDPLPGNMRNTQLYYVQNYIQDMISSMMGERLNDVSSKADAPFGAAFLGFGNFLVAKTKDAMSLSVLPKGKDIVTPLAAAYRELLRASRGGFTQGEYERAKSQYLSNWKTRYNNRDNRENVTFVNRYVRSFIDSRPNPDIETEYQLVTQLAQMIPLQAINQVIAQAVTPDNRVAVVMLPDSPDGVYPTPEQFEAAISSVDAEDIEPLREATKDEPLIEQLPSPGKIVKESTDQRFGATVWTLSNGATVVVKPTKFKADEILFSAEAKGGTSKVSADKVNALTFMPAALNSYGLGTYTNSDLQKYLAGKQVGISFGFDRYTRSIEGSSTVSDLPSLMELIYMSMTDLTLDPEEYEALQNTYVGVLHNQESNPEYIFNTKVQEALYNNSPKVKILNAEVAKTADRQQILDIVHSMTANAADYTFYFVGNVDLEQLRPLVEQYIATIPGDPATRSEEIYYDPELNIKGGKGVDSYTAKMQTPQTYVMFVEWGTSPYTLKNSQLASVAGQILSARLIDIVREKEGAVYSIFANGSMSRVNPQPVKITSAFPMKPEMKEKVLGILEEQLEALAQGVTADELAKVQEFMVKTYTEGLENNKTWLGAMVGAGYNGVDTMNGAIESVKSITPEEVAAFARQILDQGNYRVIVLDPAE